GPRGCGGQPRAPEERQGAPWAAKRDRALFAEADGVVNLAGAGVGDRRWNDRYKQLVRSSRVDTTSTLAITIAGLPAADRPEVLLNASASGWYGNTGDQVVEEDAPAGEGLLADVAGGGAGATRPAEAAGVRLWRPRTGPPLHAAGWPAQSQLLPVHPWPR
ncbi:epimerase, partial [Micromonospora fiedleri]|nr:epimerase [Micromonospora fiedleri]